MDAVAPKAESTAENPARLGIVQSRPMTYEQFLAWAPEGGLTEWIDGEGVQYMPATRLHQDLTGLIYTLLRLFLAATRLGS
ncbi:MAG: hypothetical protein NZM18_03685, partial [Thermoflexales bacterium]|nr:hypothetical protein [Thermoflexales bacterium]